MSFAGEVELARTHVRARLQVCLKNRSVKPFIGIISDERQKRLWLARIVLRNHQIHSSVSIMSTESRPIQIGQFQEALRDLSDENLEAVRIQLQVSLRKLRETNAELANEIESTTVLNDLKIYEETIDENEVVIENQTERLASLEEELAKRGVISDKDGVTSDKDGVYL